MTSIRESLTESASCKRISDSIQFLRGQKVLLDFDLAVLYGVETKVLLQAVRRNLKRFPDDFMFELSDHEWESLRSQIVTLKTGCGQHRKYRPQAIAAILSAIRALMNPPPSRAIGFTADLDAA